MFESDLLTEANHVRIDSVFLVPMVTYTCVVARQVVTIRMSCA